MAKSIRLDNETRKRLEVRSGLDELKQFIPDKDYTDALIEHASLTAPELNDAGERVSPSWDNMIAKGVAILSYLRDNGYDFSVKADRRPGQLSAQLADSNVSIRIMDANADSQYVGRVYNEGVTYRFSSRDAYRTKSIGDSITPEMAVDLVKYAIGETVHRISREGAKDIVLDDTVGTNDKTVRKFGAPHTFSSKRCDTFSTLYAKGKPTESQDDNGKTIRISNDISIKCETNKKSSNALRFDGDDALFNAETFVEDSRAAAELNFTAQLKLSAVDKLARMKSNGEFDGMPEFSDNAFVADMQKEYYNQRLAIYNGNYDDEQDRTDDLFANDNDMRSRVSAMFGNASLRIINPVNVSAYMNSKSMLTNEANLVTALKAIQKHGEAYDIVGDGFVENGFKEKMVAYDSKPVYDNNGKQLYPLDIKPGSETYDTLSDFWKQMGRSVYDGLAETGVNVDSIHVDQKGIVHYEGSRHIGMRAQSLSNNKVIGNLGQIFEPDEREFNPDGSVNLKKGLIETKFNTNENYYIAPGYTAYVVPPVDENDNRSFEERTRLRGYVQMMSDKIRATLRHDIVANDNYDNTSGLNSVYHHIYGDKFSLDFEKRMREEGKDVTMMKAINETALRRVRYDNCYKDGTSMLAKVNAEQKIGKASRGYDMYLDNVQSVMAIMNAETSKGIFDPLNTGTGTNQGIVRYLVSDAQVNPDGSITKGESEWCPICQHPDFEQIRHNPPDRAIMSLMNAMNQSSTARGRDINPAGEKISKIGVGTAHMALGGYTQDDAFVVSKEFADSNLIRDKNGNMRSLKIGDKICDHSGNKGVISFVADRNADMAYYKPDPIAPGMSDYEYKDIDRRNNTKELQRRTIEIFKENPTLDVIGAPYTAPSRFNGGTARELIASQDKAREAGMPTDLNIEGRVVRGAIGYCNWIVTDMPVDEKTHLYDTEGGRKSSGQLVWGLAELGAKEIIDEIYRYNDAPTVKTREMMLAMGLDLSETGEIRRGYQPHITGLDENNQPVIEQRNVFSIKDVFESNRDAAGNCHRRKFLAAFDQAVGDDGGFMKLPFPLKMASGDITQEILDADGNGTGEYLLPVLAGKYRSSRETVDNKLLLHEYTSTYKAIYEQAGKYFENVEKAQQNADNVAERDAALNECETCITAAQRTYDSMADDIAERYFTGKHNIFKDEVMRKQLHGTATAVISPDGSLDLDEISMTATTAIALGIDVDSPDAQREPIVVWRDPLLSGGGIRAFNARLIENRPDHAGYDARNPLNDQIGIAMNPSSATSFEGDFDGDSVGLYVPQSEAAKECANRVLSYPSQLINREAGEKGKHAMYFQDGLDVAAGVYYDKLAGGNVADRFAAANAIANEADLIGNKSVGINSPNRKAFALYNQAMHDAQNAAFGKDVINYASPEEHVKSLIPMVQSGAKGSPSKLVNGYAKYFGAKFEIDDNYEVKNFEDTQEAYVTPEERQASLAATHAKAYLTGVAGKFSQHAEMMALNASDEKNSYSCSAAATALTHPVTQSVMQLKHDTAESILHKIDMICDVAPELWAGHKIQPCIDQHGNPSWEVLQRRNSENNRLEPVIASPAEWKKMFMDFYMDKNGLNVGMPNPEHVETMAKIMTVTENGREFIQGFDTKTKALMAMEQPLTRLAYEGSFNTLCEYADMKAKTGKAASLFDGNVSMTIAPKTVRHNIAEAQKTANDSTYVADFKALAAKDTQCRPVLDTPSVDVVDKYLSEKADSEIHMEMPSAGKSYANMDVNERRDTIESLAKKSYAYSSGCERPVLTKAEQEAYVIVKKQRDIMKTLSNQDAIHSYQADNPGCFYENMMYNSFRKKAAEKTAQVTDRKTLDDLSAEDFNATAKSVVEKWSRDGGEPTDLNPFENELKNRLKAQNSRLVGMSAAQRSKFISEHAGEFKERIVCSRIRRELEAQNEVKSVVIVQTEPSKKAVPTKESGFAEVDNAVSRIQANKVTDCDRSLADN